MILCNKTVRVTRVWATGYPKGSTYGVILADGREYRMGPGTLLGIINSSSMKMTKPKGARYIYLEGA